MKKIVLGLIFLMIIVSLIGVVSAEYSCSQDSDCKIHICSTVCVNDSFTIQQNCTEQICPARACAFPPELLPKKCSCINNICVDKSEYNFCTKDSDCGIVLTEENTCANSSRPVTGCGGPGCHINYSPNPADYCKCINKKCFGITTTNSSVPVYTSGCKSLYWIDNDNKNCSQKQFCGMYMYLGLQTFEDKEICLKTVNKNSVCTKEAKVCPNGHTVGRTGPNCEFASCNDNNETSCEKDEDCPPVVCYKAPCEPMICVNNKCKFNYEICPENTASENGKCYKNLSNGRKAEIKIMPDTASETAIAKLGDLGFTIELKEIGKGGDAKVIYELTGNKEGRFLGIFKIIARVKAQVDAETGNVKVIKPWWSFLASRV